MSNTLAEVWIQVENLLTQNISIIPVRDRDEVIAGEVYAAKTPYRKWKTYQHEIITRDALWQQMNERGTTAIAMVCGAISGNLEVIDFDVKYKPGIDSIVLNAMNDLYPDLIAKMRVHKTRSGGTHLVYRIADHEVPGSCKLAEREATEEELLARPKGGKTRCFIETRGTGGLATAPPSLGYLVRRDIPIQTITWEERCTIVELCKAYNEYVKLEKPYTPPKSEVSYYDENPFEHYNRAVEPVELLRQFDWEYVRRHGDYIWFTRPGGRKGDVHGGFNINKRTFRVFSTNSGLDADRSYTPSTLLAYYRYNEDKSLTYHYLVSQGYGRIKPSMEHTIARRRAMQGQPMPTNASASAVEEYQRQREQLLTAHPHGIYWEPDPENDKIVISRLSFKEVAVGLGYRLFLNEIVQIVGQFIHRRTLREFFDGMREYIHEEDPDIFEEIYNSTQTFLQKCGEFESTQLPFLDQDTVLKDTRGTCYKFYQNGYVLITPQGYQLHKYETITEKFIWFEKIQTRDFIESIPDTSTNNGHTDNGMVCGGRGLYTSFLELACQLSSNSDHVMKVVGWLAHDYKDTTTGYIITLVEKCADPKDGGGSGKNLFCELLRNTTTYRSIPAGKKLEHTNLLQAWRGEKVFALSDAKKDFDMEMLKEPASGSAINKKLFKDEQALEVEDVPKFIVLTNFSYDISDGGLKRRIIAVEFTNFFTQCGGVDRYFGKFFPNDWSQEDWADYDHFICKSVQLWISGGLKLQPIELEGGGWEKQFVFVYGQTLFEFFTENWEKWKSDTWISNTEFNRQLDLYMAENNLNPHKYKPSGTKINNALQEWCRKHKWSMSKNEVRRNGFDTERGRKFYEDAPF